MDAAREILCELDDGGECGSLGIYELALLARQLPDAPKEFPGRASPRFPRQQIWWALRRRFGAGHPSSAHIHGQCNRCPKAGCRALVLELRSFAWRQFTRTVEREDVCDTQNARKVPIVSPLWLRPRHNTTSKMPKNTSRSICVPGIITTKGSA